MFPRCSTMLAAAVLATAGWGEIPRFPALRVPDALGVNIHFTTADPGELELLTAGGFRFVRMDLFWVAVEFARGRYDFSAYDQLLSALEARGVRAMLILDYDNPLYEQGRHVLTEEGRQAFARFAEKAAARYRGRGVIWEIWNEPNIEPFWSPQPSVEAYLALAQATAAAIRRADADATIVAPATSGIDLAFLEACFAGGLLEVIDAVTVHPYRVEPPETVTADYLALRTLVARYAPRGSSRPVLSGEWGYSATDVGSDTQGRYLARQWLANLASGVPLSIWYDWRNDGTDANDREHNFGTVTRSLEPKPAYAAAQTLTTVLDRCEPQARLLTGVASDWLLSFRCAGDYALAAWSSGEPRAVTLPVGRSRGSVVSFTGGTTPFATTGAGLPLTLTDAPQYVRFTALDGTAVPELSWRITPAPEVVRGGEELAVLLTVERRPSGVAAAEMTRSGGASRVRQRLQGRVGATLLVATPLGSSSCEVWLPAGLSSTRVVLGKALRNAANVPVTARLLLDGQALQTSREATILVAEALASRFLPLPPHGVALELASPVAGERFSGYLELVGRGEHLPVALEGTRPVRVLLPVAEGAEGTYEIPKLRLFSSGGTLVAEWAPRAVRIAHDFSRHGTGGWSVVLAGNPQVPAEASLSFASSPESPLPEWNPAAVARIDYWFGAGWRYLELLPPASLTRIPDVPAEVGVWVYLDGSGNWVIVRLVDATNQTHQIYLGRATGSGWHYLAAPTTGGFHFGGADDGVLHPPLRWESPFLFDSVGASPSPRHVFVGPSALFTPAP
jgi:hypothetical protein